MTFYHYPTIGREGEDPRPDVSIPQNEFALTIGSDLVISSNPDGLQLNDSSANFLCQIALVGAGVTHTDVLPYAIATAKALFPNHLLTEM